MAYKAYSDWESLCDDEEKNVQVWDVEGKLAKFLLIEVGDRFRFQTVKDIDGKVAGITIANSSKVADVLKNILLTEIGTCEPMLEKKLSAEWDPKNEGLCAEYRAQLAFYEQQIGDEYPVRRLKGTFLVSGEHAPVMETVFFFYHRKVITDSGDLVVVKVATHNKQDGYGHGPPK